MSRYIDADEIKRQKVKNILAYNFAAVYCNTCQFNMDDDCCEGCHRKYMNWRLSESEAESIARKILEALDEVTE